MKKQTYLIGFVLSVLSISANCQIYTPGGTIQGSTGNNSIGIGTSTPSTETSLQINRTATGTYSRGIATYITPQNTAPTGLYARVYSETPLTSYRTYGLTAEVGNATTGWNFGVMAKLLGSNNGAAIMGLVPGRSELNVGAMWAGYFRGNVFVEDNLGIGIAPQAKLHVNGGMYINGKISFYSSGSNSYYNGIVTDASGNLLFNVGPTAPIMQLTSNSVSIGCSSSGKLNVNGKIQATEIEIKSGPCSDYVFEKEYKLMNLSELENFVNANKHLPEVPSAKEFNNNGYSLGQMDDLLLRKVEELTLYIINLKKENIKLQEQINSLKN